MLIKPGVDISRVCRECRRAFNAIEAIYPDFVVTSTYEGTHSASSLHYANRAFDVRIGYPRSWAEIDPEKLAKAVGAGFDVLREATHFHIEWDPK